MLIHTDGYKIVAFSDLHARFWGGDNLAPTEAVLRKIAAFTAKHKPDLLFFGGDLIHSHFGGAYEIDIRLISLLKTAFNDWILPHVKSGMICAVGNHDRLYNHTINPNSLLLLTDSYMEDPVIIRTPDGVEVLPRSEAELEGKRWVGLWHVDLSNAELTGVKGKGEDIWETSKGAEKVLLGHYHNPHESSNLIFLGSTNHMSFNDAGSDKFVYCFNWGDSFDLVEKQSLMDEALPRWVTLVEAQAGGYVNAHVRIDYTVPLEDHEEVAKAIREAGALSCSFSQKPQIQGEFSDRGVTMDSLKEEEVLDAVVEQHMALYPPPEELGDRADILAVIKGIYCG